MTYNHWGLKDIQKFRFNWKCQAQPPSSSWSWSDELPNPVENDKSKMFQMGWCAWKMCQMKNNSIYLLILAFERDTRYFTFVIYSHVSAHILLNGKGKDHLKVWGHESVPDTKVVYSLNQKHAFSSVNPTIQSKYRWFQYWYHPYYYKRRGF